MIELSRPQRIFLSQMINSEHRRRYLEVRRSGQMLLLGLPRLGLGSEFLQIKRVLRMQHRLISLWLAEIRKLLIKELIAALEQIQLGIKQLRIVMLIQRSILIPQKSQPLKHQQKIP